MGENHSVLVFVHSSSDMWHTCPAQPYSKLVVFYLGHTVSLTHPERELLSIRQRPSLCTINVLVLLRDGGNFLFNRSSINEKLPQAFSVRRVIFLTCFAC